MRKSVWQIVNSFGGLFLMWVLMYFSLNVGYWLTLLLSILAAGFAVRIFIIQHDCGHGHTENPIMQRVVQLTLWTSFKTTSLALWDEEKRTLVSFREALQGRNTLPVSTAG